MPLPRPGESKDSYISRAIKEFRAEGIPQEEAVGRAFGFWKSYSGKSKFGAKRKKMAQDMMKG
jgi:hypothetical protein